jgi:hypothetical protein
MKGLGEEYYHSKYLNELKEKLCLVCDEIKKNVDEIVTDIGPNVSLHITIKLDTQTDQIVLPEIVIERTVVSESVLEYERSVELE